MNRTANPKTVRKLQFPHRTRARRAHWCPQRQPDAVIPAVEAGERRLWAHRAGIIMSSPRTAHPRGRTVLVVRHWPGIPLKCRA